MTPKEIFINGCQEIAQNFPDFKVSQKGKKLSKKSKNSLLEFSIIFETSHRNYSGSVAIVPHILIDTTKAFKKRLEIYQFIDDDFVIYSQSLGYLNPRQEYHEWNLAGASFHHSTEQISEQIKTYMLPIFEIFENPSFAIDFLIKNGTKFNPYIKNLALNPVYFILAFGTKQQVSEFVVHYANHCGYKGKFVNSYQQLKSLPKEKLFQNTSAFIGEIILKDLIINDIEIDFV